MKNLHINSIIKRAKNNLVVIAVILVSATNSYSQVWSTVGSGGMDAWVYASTIYNGELRVGGKFTLKIPR